MQLLTEPENPSLSWFSIGSFLNRYKWLILGVFLVVAVGGWATLQIFFNDLYETKATLLVKIGRETSEVPTTVVNGQLLSQGVRIQDINSEVQLLSSREFVETVVDRIGADRYKSVLVPPTSIWGYPKYWLKSGARWAKGVYKEALIVLNIKKRLTHRDEVVLAVAEATKVEPVKESDVLTLKLRLPSQELAVLTAQGILDEYMKRRSEVRRNAPTFKFFEEEARDLQVRLSQLADRRASVRNKWEVSSAAEQRSLMLKQVMDLEAQRVAIEGRVRSLEQEQREMNDKLRAMPSTLTKEEMRSRNPALQSLKERITSLQMERARTLGKYQPDSETVKKLDSELEALQRSLATEEGTILASTTSQPNPLREEFQRGIQQREVELAGLRSQLARIDEPIGKLRAQIGRVTSGGDQMESTERELRLAEAEYLAFSRRKEEARIAEELDSKRMANVSMVAAPEYPIEPVYPRKLFIMGILLPVGLVLGIGIAVLMESMTDQVRTVEDALLLDGIQFLGSVHIPAEPPGGSRRPMGSLTANVVAGSEAAAPGPPPWHSPLWVRHWWRSASR